MLIINEEKCVVCGKSIPEGRMVCSTCEWDEPRFNTIKIIVLLNKITDISEFVKLSSICKDDVIIKSGNYAVDAKSLMGVYSLDLSKPLKVEFYGDIPLEVEEGMKKFIVN